MKKPDQHGFILMMAVMILFLIAVIGLAFMRVQDAAVK